MHNSHLVVVCILCICVYGCKRNSRNLEAAPKSSSPLVFQPLSMTKEVALSDGAARKIRLCIRSLEDNEAVQRVSEQSMMGVHWGSFISQGRGYRWQGELIYVRDRGRQTFLTHRCRSLKPLSDAYLQLSRPGVVLTTNDWDNLFTTWGANPTKRITIP